MENKFEQIKAWYRGLPDKKRYVEFFTAILTVPVLVTVIIANVRSLNSATGRNDTPVPSPLPTVIVVEKPSTVNNSEAAPTSTPYPLPTPATVAECRREVGPVTITAPPENAVTGPGPVCIDISYTRGDYCSVVWSYRINGGSWSEYSDKSICLYGLEPGEKNLEIRVRSIASDDEELLKRKFTVPGATPTPESSASGQFTN